MINNLLEQLCDRYPKLLESKVDIQMAYAVICSCYSNEGKLLIAGNGGSAADAGHMTAELMKGFILPRKVDIAVDNDDRMIMERLQSGLPAISLSAQSELITAISNDNGADMVFAQQVFAYAKANDVFIGFSTSGNSLNVINATKVAKQVGLKTIIFTGKNGGALKNIADISICVPETVTYKIQELHLPIYHVLCIAVEEHFFAK